MSPYRKHLALLFILIEITFSATLSFAQERIHFKADEALYPEGIAYDPTTDTFIVSSMKQGKLGRVDRKGNYKVFADDESLVSSHGIQVDEKRNRILVCVGDNGTSIRSNEQTTLRLARVVEFELSTGKLKRIIDLSDLDSKHEKHIANDLAIDDAGNVYVTDSFAPVIYKIPLDGEPSIFITNPDFEENNKIASGLQPNLNGILYHPNGFIVVADWHRGILWRIPIKKPSSFKKIKLTNPVQGIDGLVLLSQKTIATIQSYPTQDGQLIGEISILESKDNWDSAAVVHRNNSTPFMNLPTTGTLAKDDLYFLNSQYAELFSKGKKASQRNYDIEKVDILKFKNTSKPNRLFQTSLADAFVAGLYDGIISFGDLKKHGDFGLGAFDHMDGEMLAFDGHFFQIKSNGKAYPVTNDMLTPLAFVTFFQPQQNIDIRKSISKDAFEELLEKKHIDHNQIYAIRIDGVFDFVKARSNPPQEKPYKPLVEVVQTQNTFEFRPIRGTLVGYKMPSFMSRFNVPGIHLHFIDKEKKVGGHVLDFKIKSGSMKIARIEALELLIPDDKAFNKIDFKLDRSQEIKKTE